MESNSTAAVSTSPLTPTERILLNGEQFGKQETISLSPSSNVTLLHTDAKVSARQLGQAMLAAALLASEEAGAIQLEFREKKALFGLRKVNTLFALPGQTIPDWPASTLEARLVELARQSQGDEVYNIVYKLVPRSREPWGDIVQMVHQGMAARGLLETAEVKHLKVFTGARWVLPETTAALSSAQPVAPVQELLAACERDRPDVWKALVKAIQSAVTARTDTPDTSSSG